jgi:hypothetical protein
MWARHSSKDCRLVNNAATPDAWLQAAIEAKRSTETEPSMHEGRKLIEQIIIGLVVAAISINILATELPRLMPYLIVLAVIFVIVRLVLFHTRKW